MRMTYRRPSVRNVPSAPAARSRVAALVVGLIVCGVLAVDPAAGQDPAVAAHPQALHFGIGELPRPTAAIVSSLSGSSVFNGVNINALVGAERFYFEGYWGDRAVMANVEAGHIWDGHETLAHVDTFVNDPSISGPTRQFDWHATMVGHTMGGRGFGYGLIINDFNLATWFGIAPFAELWSGAIASAWVPDPDFEYTGTFEVTPASLLFAYRTVIRTGVAGRTADVVNSSWGGQDPAGNSDETLLLDALVYAHGTTLVLAGGNHLAGTAQVDGPGSGYNSITVAALVSDTSVPPYGMPADFTNTGPNDFHNAKLATTEPAVRAAIDLAAPGDNLTLGFYGGVTGGHTSGTDLTGGSGQYYVPDMGGTSFAAPTVAGGAALVVDVGYDRFGGGVAIDGRVVKAVLMNAAMKTAGWDNGQSLIGKVIRTDQGLDWAVGAGRMDLDRAFDQYTAGTTDVPGLAGGSVQAVGWDFGQVAAGAPNDYAIARRLTAGDRLTVTLDWFVNRFLDEQMLSVGDVQFADLDLEIWRGPGGTAAVLVAASESAYNNVEHLSFAVPADGFYVLRVLWYGEVYDLPGDTPDAEHYGLAWSVQPVPEPATLWLLGLGAAWAMGWAVRRGGRIEPSAVTLGPNCDNYREDEALRASDLSDRRC